MSAEEQTQETAILIDSASSIVRRIEDTMFGPAPEKNVAAPIPIGLMGRLEENRVRLNGLVGRLQVLEQALTNGQIKAAVNLNIR